MAQENAHNGEADKKAVSFFSLKPQLVFQAPKAADAVKFYKDAFGAEELNRDTNPKRKADQELPLILCAELKLGSSVFMVCDQTDESETPAKTNGSGVMFCLETNDVDAAVTKAIKAGAAAVGGEITEGEVSCCGARVEKVKDPYGYIWLFCSAGKVADVEA